MQLKADETNLNADLTPAAYDEHFKTEHFANLRRVIGEEGLLAAPLDMKKVREFARFESR
jgi:hypothetical protein